MPELFFPVLIITLGVLLGSFTTLLIPRLHDDEKGILFGRSHCAVCGKKLAWYNLIPLFSWMFQRGRASCCGQKIPFIYPLVELSFVGVFGIFVYKFYPSLVLLPLLITAVFGLWFFWYDAWFYQVDRRISFPAIFWAGAWILLSAYEVSYFAREGFDFWNMILGGAIGGGFYLVQYSVSRGKWVGWGDVEIGLFLGLILGDVFTLLALFIAYILGSVVGLILFLCGKANRTTPLPMGVFLMMGLLLMLLWGTEISQWYFDLIGWHP